jgi:hypothetical protein
MAITFSCKSEGRLYPFLHTGNYLKKEPVYSDFKEAVVVLTVKASFNLNEMCEDFCIIKPKLVLFFER